MSDYLDGVSFAPIKKADPYIQAAREAVLDAQMEARGYRLIPKLPKVSHIGPLMDSGEFYYVDHDAITVRKCDKCGAECDHRVQHCECGPDCPYPPVV